MLERLAAFVQIAVIASIYGASTRSDLYFIASIVPLTLGTVVGEALATSALPALVKRQFEATFSRFLAATFWGSLAVLLAVLLVYLLVIAPIVALAGPAGTTSLLPWLAFSPTVVTLGLSAFLSSILLLCERYTWPPFRAAAASIAGLALTLVALIFTRHLVWIALATTGGYFIALLLLLADVRRAYGYSFVGRPGKAELREAARLKSNATVALAGNLIGGQSFVLLERALAASLGVGAVSTISYARGVVFTPNIAGQAVSMGIYPGMVRAHEADDVAFVRGAFLRGLRLTILMALAVVIFFSLFGSDLVRMLLERGQLNAHDAAAVTHALLAFMPAIVGTMLLILTSRVFYAVDFFRGIVLSQLGALLPYIPLALALRAAWNTNGLALGFGIAELTGGLLAVSYAIRLTRTTRAELRPVAAVVRPLLFVAAVLAAIRLALNSWPPAGSVRDTTLTLVGGVATISTLAIFLLASNWPEVGKLRRGLAALRNRRWHSLDRQVAGRRRIITFGAAALVEVALLALLPVVGVPLAGIGLVAAVVRRPGTILAISWNGFWLYLAALDLLNVEPRTRLTAAAYALIAVGLGAFVWQRRAVLVRRLAGTSTLTRLWLAASALLAVWFVANVALLSHGSLSHRLAGVFVISTVPTVVAVGCARRRDLAEARAGLVLLGLAFVAVECIAARHVALQGGRFSPIGRLDPISASLVPTVAALAAATYAARTPRRILLQSGVLAALGAGAALNAARGPLVAIVLALIVTAIVSLGRRGVFVVAATCLGLFVGSAAVAAGFSASPAISSLVKESSHLAGGPTSGKTGAQSPTSGSTEISSLSIRRQWLEEAVRAIPRKPVAGHGVGMLVDNTPEAHRMGVAGQLVYPHNDFVESAYSLGLPGLLLFSAFVLLPLVALWRRRDALRSPTGCFAVAVFTFAFLESNFSGEIGTDVLLWSGAALALAIFDAGRRPAAP